MAVIEIKNLNQGGIADSDYLGLTNSVAEMVGLDIHSAPGLIKVNQKLKKESGNIVTELCQAATPSSDGNSYWFGKVTGKIWRRSSTGTWTLQAIATPLSGSPGITGAKEYQGYIYYAMQNRLGRWQIGTPWATRNDNFATFTNGDADFHPMRILNLVLYIGDANLVAQVDAGVFSANALDISDPYRIKCLGNLGTDLLIGTFVNNFVYSTEIYRWNTWSVSFSTSDSIPEVGINSFLATDNFVIVSAGTKGKLYLYNGSQLDDFRQLKGNWDANNKAVVNPESTFNFGGIALFGLSKMTGNPTTLGIYSMARSNRNYPYVLNTEYVVSTDHTVNVEYGAIIGAGDVFLVSWQDGAGAQVGVDVLDLANKYPHAYFTTRVIMPNRMSITNFGRAQVGYRSLPTGTDLKMYIAKNNAPLAIKASTNDTKRRMKYTEKEIDIASTLQLKVEFIANGNNAPEVELGHLIVK
jgi:hypothetical protein